MTTRLTHFQTKENARPFRIFGQTHVPCIDADLAARLANQGQMVCGEHINWKRTFELKGLQLEDYTPQFDWRLRYGSFEFDRRSSDTGLPLTLKFTRHGSRDRTLQGDVLVQRVEEFMPHVVVRHMNLLEVPDEFFFRTQTEAPASFLGAKRTAWCFLRKETLAALGESLEKDADRQYVEAILGDWNTQTSFIELASPFSD